MAWLLCTHKVLGSMPGIANTVKSEKKKKEIYVDGKRNVISPNF